MVLAWLRGIKMTRKKVTFYMILTIIGGLMFLGCQAWNGHICTAKGPGGEGILSTMQTVVRLRPTSRILFYHHRSSTASTIFRGDHQYYHADQESPVILPGGAIT